MPVADEAATLRSSIAPAGLGAPPSVRVLAQLAEDLRMRLKRDHPASVPTAAAIALVICPMFAPTSTASSPGLQQPPQDLAHR